MIVGLAVSFGPWSWWILGLILLAAELAMPGFFLIWIGAAAIVTGVLSLGLWDNPIWLWQIQLLVFAALSMVSIVLGRRLFSRTNRPTDEPFLNQRGESLVGRTATLAEPIANGRGRIRLDDTYWSVMGPDLPSGTTVKVVASHGRDLKVEPAA